MLPISSYFPVEVFLPSHRSSRKRPPAAARRARTGPQLQCRHIHYSPLDARCMSSATAPAPLND